MDKLMKAIMLEAPNTVNLREIPVPTPKNGEILIKLKAGTVCTSDIMDMKYGIFTDNLPMVMGHEAAGVVAEVGDDVVGVQVGDEVAVHPVMSCYKCPSCLRGLSHLCEKMEHLCFNRPGAFSEYFVSRPDCVRKKPPEMSFAVASLMEGVCCSLEAVRRGNVKRGDRVLIAGDGPFGIMISRLCAINSPKQIIQTGYYDFRLKQAAGSLVKTLNIKEEPNLEKTIFELTNEEGIDCAILCVSDPKAMDLCVEILRPRGTLVIYSAISEKTPVDLMRVHLNELNIVGSNNDEGYMDEAIKMLSDPKLDFKSIITHEIPFDEWEEAFRIADEQKDRCLKVSMIL